MKYTINMKHFLFIAIIIAETQQNCLSSIQFRHIAFMFSESDINRTRKSEVNKPFTDFIKEYFKQNEKSYEHVPCHAIIEKSWEV